MVRGNQSLMRTQIGNMGIGSHERLGGDTSHLGVEGIVTGMEETREIAKRHFPTTLIGLQKCRHEAQSDCIIKCIAYVL